MIRITTSDDALSTLVTLDGQLSSECIDLVETCCRDAVSRKKQVELFLRDVSTIDQAGHSLLHRLAKEGVHLSAAGIYCSHIVGVISSEAT